MDVILDWMDVTGVRQFSPWLQPGLSRLQPGVVQLMVKRVQCLLVFAFAHTPLPFHVTWIPTCFSITITKNTKQNELIFHPPLVHKFIFIWVAVMRRSPDFVNKHSKDNSVIMRAIGGTAFSLVKAATYPSTCSRYEHVRCNLRC